MSRKQIIVKSLLLRQRFVISDFDDATPSHNRDLVRVLDRRQAVNGGGGGVRG